MKTERWDFWKIVTVVILLIFLLFLVYPMVSMFIKGFQDPATGDWTVKHYQKFFGKRYYYRALLNSFKVTFAVTILSVLVGVPIAYFMSYYHIKGSGFLSRIIRRASSARPSFMALR